MSNTTIVTMTHLLECLKDSELFDKLTKDKITQTVTIPKEYVLHHLRILNKNDFLKIIKAFDYWKIRKIPFSVYDFLRFRSYDFELDDIKYYDKYLELNLVKKHGLSNSNNRHLIIYDEFEGSDGENGNFTDYFVDKVIENGFVNLLSYVISSGYDIKNRNNIYEIGTYSNIINVAFKYKQKEIIDFLIKKGAAISISHSNIVYLTKDVDFIKYVHQNIKKLNPIEEYCNNYTHVFSDSKLLSFLEKENLLKVHLDSKAYYLLEYNQMELFKELIKSDDYIKLLNKNTHNSHRDILKSGRACTACAVSGNLKNLKYIHSIGGVITDQAAKIAAETGRIECIEYFLDNGSKLRDSLLYQILQI